MRRFFAGLILSGTVAASGGCIFLLGAGAGAGGYSWIRGEMQRTYPAKLERTWSASLQALKSLQLKVVEQSKDGLGGRIKAERADGTGVFLSLKVKDPGTTTIGVRVGVMGKKKPSEQIHDRIARYLR